VPLIIQCSSHQTANLTRLMFFKLYDDATETHLEVEYLYLY